MSDDLLKRATQALRETSEEPNMRSGLTRARLLESAERKTNARRGYGLRWALAAAGLLVAGTALARVADQLPALIEAIMPSNAPERPEPQQPKPQSKRASATPAAAAAPTPTLIPVPVPVPMPVPAAPTPPVAIDHAPRAQRPRSPRPTATAATPAPAPIPAPAPTATPAPQPESAELTLFRRAQRLHLARDPQTLAAWDAYLRVAEQGALVPEARYNRALCLLRMGRTAEARGALAPFARGVYGAYRQVEAQRLLEALAR